MGTIASQITSLTMVYSAVYSDVDQKTSKLRVTGLWAGNSPETGEIPAQMASNAANVSIWWRHHELGLKSRHCTHERFTAAESKISAYISIFWEECVSRRSFVFSLKCTILSLWKKDWTPWIKWKFIYLCSQNSDIVCYDQQNIQDIKYFYVTFRIISWLIDVINDTLARQGAIKHHKTTATLVCYLNGPKKFTQTKTDSSSVRSCSSNPRAVSKEISKISIMKSFSKCIHKR